MIGAYYDVALYVRADTTLAQLYVILDRLEDMGIGVDYASFDFEDNGLFFDARDYSEDPDLEGALEAIGVGIDWDTMAEWGSAEVEE